MYTLRRPDPDSDMTVIEVDGTDYLYQGPEDADSIQAHGDEIARDVRSEKRCVEAVGLAGLELGIDDPEGEDFAVFWIKSLDLDLNLALDSDQAYTLAKRILINRPFTNFVVTAGLENAITREHEPYIDGGPLDNALIRVRAETLAISHHI